MFDLYFAGEGSKEAQQYIRENNANQLLSQLNERKQILDWIEYLKTHLECKSKLFIDSGAYSAWTKGKVIDVEEYIDFLNKNSQYIYIFAGVDVIPGVKEKFPTEEEVNIAAEATWKNYLYMREKIKEKDKLLYTFHVGEPFEYLERAICWSDEFGDKIKYIAFGGLVGKSSKLRLSFINKAFSIIKNSTNPNIQIHGFGLTSLSLLEQFSFTSADSTSWIMTAINGGVLTPMGTLTISDRQINSSDHITSNSEDSIKNLNEYFNNYGFTIEELQNDSNKRVLYNLKYLSNWQNNYKFKGNNLFKKTLISVGEDDDNN